MKTKNPSVWDVSPEDEVRINLPANDCRRFNGGEVASTSIRQFWPSENEKPQPPLDLPIKIIDRLRV